MQFKRFALAATLAVAVAGIPATAQAAPKLKLKGEQGRLVSEDGWQTYKRLGGGDTAKATWTDSVFATGSYSFELAKYVPTSDPSYAAAIVDGVEGLDVADLGTIGFKADVCGGGAPRFNLHFDGDGDGDYDGTGFFGCANNATVTSGGWTTMSTDPIVDDNGTVISATAKVLSLSVIVDEQGTYHVDDVTVAGQTIGEPSGA